MDLLYRDVQRIEIAGALRRGAANIYSLELVVMAKPRPDIFEVVSRPHLGIVARISSAGWKIFRVEENAFILFAIPVRGGTIGIPVALYLTTPEKWGLTMALKTGPTMFAHRLMTRKVMGGYLPADMQMTDGRLYFRDIPLDTPEETDVFSAIGLNYIPPEERI